MREEQTKRLMLPEVQEALIKLARLKHIELKVIKNDVASSACAQKPPTCHETESKMQVLQNNDAQKTVNSNYLVESDNESEDVFQMLEAECDEDIGNELQSDSYDQLEDEANEADESELDKSANEASSEQPKTSGKTGFPCQVCNQLFKTPANAKRHFKRLHLREKRIHCDVCGKACKDAEYLELHMNLHEGKSEYECRFCPKRYTHKNNVIRHMQKHWDKKSYQCERCGKRFSERPVFYNHRLVHDAEDNPLTCGTCGKTFKTKRTYSQHLQTHLADRPRYGCTNCGRTFVGRYLLKLHLRCQVPPRCNGNRGK